MFPGTGNHFARLVWPCLFFLGAKLFVGAVALRAGADPQRPDDYARWDSGHYLAIAARGYEFKPCPPDAPARWCGNTAWMPGYSFSIRGLEATGMGGPLAGVLIASLTHLATLLILWIFLWKDPPPGGEVDFVSRFLLLALAAFFPGMIYYHAIFPVAPFALCLLLFLIDLEAGRSPRAALWGGLAALMYSPGILLAAVAPIRFWFHAGTLGRRLARGVTAAAGPGAGFLLSLVIQYLDTGEPFAFFLIQRQYGRDFAPLGVLLWLGDQLWSSPFRPVRIAAFQSLAVATGVIGLLWFARPWRPSRSDRIGHIHLSAYLLLLVLWLFPLSIGRGISLYRSEACLMPAVLLLLPRSKRGGTLLLLVCLLLIFLTLAALMSDLFFRDLLVAAPGPPPAANAT